MVFLHFMTLSVDNMTPFLSTQQKAVTLNATRPADFDPFFVEFQMTLRYVFLSLSGGL